MDSNINFEKVVEGLKRISVGFYLLAESINSQLEKAETEPVKKERKTKKDVVKETLPEVVVKTIIDPSKPEPSYTDANLNVPISDAILIEITKELVLADKTEEVKQLFKMHGIKKCQDCPQEARHNLLLKLNEIKSKIKKGAK